MCRLSLPMSVNSSNGLEGVKDVAPCDAMPEAKTVEQAVLLFQLHGFAIISAELLNIDAGSLTIMHDEMVAYAPKPHQLRGAKTCAPRRWSLNDQEHIHNPIIRELLESMFATAASLPRILDGVLGDPRWYFELWGGDVVMPGGRGMDLHSDWADWNNKSEMPSTLALSLFASECGEACAPIVIESKSTSVLYKILGPVGSALLRDVNVPHGGTANTSHKVRCLPCVRLFHTEHIRLGWRPQRYIVEEMFQAYFGNAPHMVECMQYLWAPPLAAEAIEEVHSDGSVDAVVLELG